MYARFYGLSTEPFSLSPDPRFCFRHPSFSRAKAYFEFAIHRGEGFVVVTGRPGTGKTTLIQDLVTDLRKSPLLVARIERTQLEADDLLRSVAYAFGMDARASDKATLLHDMEALLLKRTGPRNRAILIVDEAQNLPEDALEELRLITNLHDRLSPLVQILLVGQEALRDRIRSPRLEQLHQRIVAAAHIEPLDPEQMRGYIQHRLLCVGWRGDPAIRGEALGVIHEATEGVPRLVNKFCDRLLVHGSIEGTHLITAEDARLVLAELRSEFLSPLDLRAPDRLGHQRAGVPVLADLVAAGAPGPRTAGQPTGTPEAAPPAGVPPDDAPPVEPKPEPADPPQGERSAAADRPCPAPGLAVPARGWTDEELDSPDARPAGPAPPLRRPRRSCAALVWAAATGLLLLAGLGTAWVLDPPGLRGLMDPLKAKTAGLVSRWPLFPDAPAAGAGTESGLPAGTDPAPERALIPVLPAAPALRDGAARAATPLADASADPIGGEPTGGADAFPAVDALAAEPEAGETPEVVVPAPANPLGVSSPETEWNGRAVRPDGPTDAGLAGGAPAEPELDPVRDSRPGAAHWPDSSPPEGVEQPPAAAVEEPFAAESPPEVSGLVLGSSLPAPASDELSGLLAAESPDLPVADPAPAGGGASESMIVGVELDRLADELGGLGFTVARSDTALRIDLVDSVPFRVDVAAIPEEARGVLGGLGRVLAGHRGISVRVIGHTDRTGPWEYNRALSERRAAAVVDRLVAAGLDPSSVAAEGRGMDEPLPSIEGPPVHVRRIEIQVEAVPDASEPRAAQNGDGTP